MKHFKIAITFAAVLTALLTPASAFAQTDIMPVSEILPGMQGVGYTVIQGTEIEEFQCEVIDVFSSMGYNGGPLIFLRISGDVVDRSGGIAGGYSGSPVYIDGRLIGALSWGPYFTEGDVCGATPIDDMLQAFTYPENIEPVRIPVVPICLNNPIDVAGHTFDSVLVADNISNAQNLENLHGENTLIMTPCRTPLIVSGLSESGFMRLQEFASDKLPYFELIQGPGGGIGNGASVFEGPVVLEPGASIGAQLASGDFDLTAIGTLTWVDEQGRFLAFGHPFLMDGLTSLPFVTSRIIYTMPALDRSYKLGEAIEQVGVVTQDRLTCIAGSLDEEPEMVDFSMTVIDHDSGITRDYNYSVIRKETWLPFLGWLVPMEGLQYTSDRAGPGTCRVSFSIYGEGLTDPVQRENLIYASYGIGDSLNEFMEALSMVSIGNPFREVNITRVEIEVEITSARQTMNIVRARFQNPPNMGPGAVGYTGPEETEEDDSDTDVPEQDMMDESWLAPILNEAQEFFDEEIPMIDDMDFVDDYTFDDMDTELIGYYPGDIVEVLVTLRPFRDETVEEVIELAIPPDFPTGQTTIEIMGGASSFYYGASYIDPMYGMDYSYMGVESPDDLEDIIELFEDRDVNNSIIISLPVQGPEDPYYYLQDEYEPEEPVRAIIETHDVITGYFSLPLEVLSDEEEENLDEIIDETLPDSEDMNEDQEQEPRDTGPRKVNITF